jgi:hypothetical protein
MNISNNLRGAFEVGQVLARYRFFLLQAEMNVEQVFNLLTDTGQELALASRRLRSGSERAPFSKGLQKRIRCQVEWFGTESMMERNCEVWDRDVLANLPTDRFLDYLEEKLAVTAHRQCKSLTQYLAQGLNDMAISAFELGDIVEQGAYTPSVWRHCFTEEPQAKTEDLSIVDSGTTNGTNAHVDDSHPSGVDSTVPHTSDDEDFPLHRVKLQHLPPHTFFALAHEPGDIPPDNIWLAQVYTRADEIGIESSLPNRTLLQDKLQTGLTESRRQVVGELARSITQALENFDQPSPHGRSTGLQKPVSDHTARPNPLGLSLSKENVIMRSGQKTPVTLEGSLQIKVFKEFLDNGDRSLDFKDLCRFWSIDAADLVDKTTQNRITKLISELRQKISPAGIKIKKTKRGGWSLKDDVPSSVESRGGSPA